MYKISFENNTTLIEDNFLVTNNRKIEGLFTLGSGYLHVRGSLEEHINNSPQNETYIRMPANVTAEKFAEKKAKWGTYVPGMYGNHPYLNRELVNLPWFIGLAPIIDGEKLDIEECKITSNKRSLNLHEAILNRKLEWQLKNGVKVEVNFERFISANYPQLCLQKMEIISSKRCNLVLESKIDADVRTNGYDHFKKVSFGNNVHNIISCHIETDLDDKCNIHSQLVGDGTTTVNTKERQVSLELSTTLEPNKTYSFEKRSIVATSRDRTRIEPDSFLKKLDKFSYESLKKEHIDHWKERWNTCEVKVVGDNEAQMAISTSIYHLLRSHVTDDNRVAIDAKGYAGEGYFGRFFWDTEMYLLPFFCYTDQKRAETLVDFRVQSLEGAKKNAVQLGYSGAKYAWESDSEGIESCALWQYRDHEVHITADVVYGFEHYVAASGDSNFFKKAARAVVETARYWSGRVSYDELRGIYNLVGVMGPDEYAPLTINNSYTNRIVKFSLECAVRYGKEGGASEEEMLKFSEISEKLILPINKNGLVLQCEEFEKLAEPQFERLWKDRNKPYASQVNQERIYRTKNLKQADVLLLMWLFPAEFTNEEVRKAWDYYVPLTTHDSSLSAAIHSLVAHRLGKKEEAWSYWNKGAFIDLDFEGDGPAEGIHIAAAGGVWLMLIFGFAGLKSALDTKILSLQPRIPQEWSSLSFNLNWKGSQVYVDINKDKTIVQNLSQSSLTIRVGETTKDILSNQQATFDN